MTLPDEFHAIAKRVNNWGRWGTDDEIGTLNFVTPEVVRKAAACVESGKRISLSVPLRLDGVQTGAIPGRVNPVRTMTSINRPITGDPSEFCMSDDVVFMGLQAATHWDGLGHVSYDGRLYNGFPASSITEAGASRCGIEKISSLVSRGVLLDVARARGVDRLEPGYPITPDDLDAAEAQARIEVGAGDVVLVRTGQMQLLKARKKTVYAAPAPGLTMATAEWFHARDVAAVATDNLTFEVYPGERDDLVFPVHLLHLVEMGMTQGQNFDLEELAQDCAADSRYAFLLDASPLPFVRAVGSPVNPVAVK
jgi:kynurenine formamidase